MFADLMAFSYQYCTGAVECRARRSSHARTCTHACIIGQFDNKLNHTKYGGALNVLRRCFRISAGVWNSPRAAVHLQTLCALRNPKADKTAKSNASFRRQWQRQSMRSLLVAINIMRVVDTIQIMRARSAVGKILRWLNRARLV